MNLRQEQVVNAHIAVIAEKSDVGRRNVAKVKKINEKAAKKVGLVEIEEYFEPMIKAEAKYKAESKKSVWK